MAALVMLCCLVPVIANSQTAAQSIYVFGDSLSDTGNLFSRTGQPTRPYVNGRFSNGLLWDDRLANQLQLTLTPVTQMAAGETAASINFAFGGATTGVDQTRDRLGLQQQVALFREQQSGRAANPNAVYLVWAGANDYLSGRSTDAAEPIANLRSAIETLIAAGARHLVVGNLPPLGQLPATRDRDSAGVLDRLTTSHNQQVAALVAEMEQRDGVTARLLEVNDLFERAIAGEFDFTNVTEACLDSQRGTICPNPNQYLFWDGIHPTSAAHERISAAALPLSVAISNPGEFKRPVAPSLLRIGVLGLGSLVAIAIAIRAKKQR
ncbi:SGNH/GDSL hydrolase family protein [Microcoleus sp. FACHB-1515]|uniref:SGNH/GDSL hydrolase family protein n=1 Tax=Cyanophyceae TaxID=3028117 RepID=UPI001682B399|nr:SGNH/GDSL hydrolase family protein [Microcoleus sp. FACHB-1515]MBD2090781.1 SGNH/GDSL hydrolase family protein [Microcoleus sp. FACHB-1515]